MNHFLLNFTCFLDICVWVDKLYLLQGIIQRRNRPKIFISSMESPHNFLSITKFSGELVLLIYDILYARLSLFEGSLKLRTPSLATKLKVNRVLLSYNFLKFKLYHLLCLDDLCPHQGDLLSPYPFILCDNVLSNFLHRKVTTNRVIGLKIARQTPQISHLFFF